MARPVVLVDIMGGINFSLVVGHCVVRYAMPKFNKSLRLLVARGIMPVAGPAGKMAGLSVDLHGQAAGLTSLDGSVADAPGGVVDVEHRREVAELELGAVLNVWAAHDVLVEME